MLGFYTLTQYAEVCKTCKNKCYEQISGITHEIRSINAQIKKLEEVANMDIIDGDISYIKSSIKNMEDEIKAITNNHENTIEDIQSQLLNKKQELATLTTLGKNKKKEIDFIKKGTCPTCGAPIDQSQLEIKLKERQILLDQYASINSHISDLTAQISQEKDKMNKSISSIKSLVKSQKNLLIQLQEQVRRMKINGNEIDSMLNNIKTLEKTLIEYQKEDIEWDQLYNILSSDVRTKILESFIPILNKNILKYTTRLQQPYIVRFDSNFKCSINVCGFEDPIPISSLSTGQLKTVDMIIILGVLGTIIGSSSTNIMFLDELFSNLDNNLRNEMCLVLKEAMKQDNTLFIISHQDLDEQYFDGFINMKLENVGQFEKKSKAVIKKQN